MYFNYAYERRLFEQDQAKKRREYLRAGMSEEAIREMYEYDLYVFNNERKEIKHRAHYSEMLTYDTETGDSRYMDMDEFPSQATLYTPNRYAWLEEIEDRKLFFTLLKMPIEYLDIITDLIDQYQYDEIGKRMGVRKQAICNKVYRIRKKLKNVI